MFTTHDLREGNIYGFLTKEAMEEAAGIIKSEGFSIKTRIDRNSTLPFKIEVLEKE